MPFPPLEFLFDASDRSLQDLELAALNRSANLTRVVKSELDEYVKQEAVAMVAKWFRNNREALLNRREIEIKPQKVEFMEREKKTA